MTSSSGEAAALVSLLRDLRADGLMVLSATVGAVHVELAQVVGPGASNIAPRVTPTVLGEYGSPAIQAAIEGDDPDEEIVAVRS